MQGHHLTTVMNRLVFSMIGLVMIMKQDVMSQIMSSIIQCTDKKGNVYQVDEPVDTGNPCTFCHCDQSGQIVCASIDCLPCYGVVIPVIDQCCGDCFIGTILVKPGIGCASCGVRYKLGEVIPTDDPCESCVCRDDIKELCDRMTCDECQGIHVPVNGTCCGECLPATCRSNGKTYEVGVNVDTGNPCEICQCGKTGSLICAVIDCEPCHGRREAVEGLCCGKCVLGEVDVMPENGCVKNGVIYEFGSVVQTSDPCESCFCSKESGILCAMADCAYCPGKHVSVEGTCCGECHICNYDDETYPVGPFIDPWDECLACVCHENGSVTCEDIECPDELPCKRWLIAVTDEDCCPVCKCRYKRRTYLPGPVGPKCDGCVCKDGKVTCQKPVCPTAKLMCADPKIGDDCCPYCPNGVTCIGPRNKIIKAGEYKRIGNQICTCAGVPWWPNCFCTPKNVNRQLWKKFGKNLAAFPFPGI